MNIHAEKGHRVKVTEITKNNGREDDKEKVKNILEIDKPYTVDRTIVHQSSTDVYLVGFPDICFNSVNFSDC